MSFKQKFKVVFPVFLIFLASSCSNISGPDSSHNENIKNTSGSILLKGTVSAELPDGAVPSALYNRSASPGTLTPAADQYFAIAVRESDGYIVGDDEDECNWSLSGSEKSFAMNLDYGNWTVKAGIKKTGAGLNPDESDIIYLSQETINLPAGAPLIYMKDFRPRPRQSENGSGRIQLVISAPVTFMTVSLLDGDESAWTAANFSDGEKAIDLSGGSGAIETPVGGIKPGTYVVLLKFYNCITNPLGSSLSYSITGANCNGLEMAAAGYAFPVYNTIQSINVYDNLTTNRWVSSATTSSSVYTDPVSGGSFSLTSSMIDAFQQTHIFVSEDGNDTSNTGTAYRPFASINKANSYINVNGNSSQDYTITIKGNITGSAVINTANAKSITLQGNAGTTNVINASANSSVLTIDTSKTVTIENLKITGGAGAQDGNGGGIYLKNGSTLKLGSGASITGNKLSGIGKGGGIYAEANTKLFMYSTAIIGDTVNSIAAGNSSDSDCSNYAETGGGIYSAGNVYIGYSGFNESSALVEYLVSSGYGVRRNYADFYGGICIAKGGQVRIGSGSISYNSAGSHCGGIGYSLEGSGSPGSLTITGGEIKKNGNIGIAIEKNASCQITGGIIGGSGYENEVHAVVVAVDGIFKIGGSAYIPAGSGTEKNDVLLDTKYNLSGELTGRAVATVISSTLTGSDTGPVATLTTSTAGWKRGVKILKADSGVTLDSTTLSTLTSKIALLEDNAGWERAAITEGGTDYVKIDSPVYVAGVYASGTGANKKCSVPPSSNRNGISTRPFASITEAIEYISDPTKDAYAGSGNNVQIIVDGNVQNAQHQIPSSFTTSMAGSLTIKGYIAPSETTSTATLRRYENTASFVSSDSGSTLVISSKVPVTIQDLKIINGKALNGGGIRITEKDADVTIAAGTEISCNSASQNGGGIYAEVSGGNPTLKITGGTIISNTAVKGGGLYINSTNAIISGGNITSNNATNGKGIYSASNLNVESAAYVDTTNDVYLKEDKTINISSTNSLTKPFVANITPEKFIRGKQVISGAVEGNLSKFAVSETGWSVDEYNNTSTSLKEGVIDAALYVSGSGNDTTGNGSAAKPYGSIEKAVSQCWNPSKAYTINVVGTVFGEQKITGTTGAPIKAASLSLAGSSSAQLKRFTTTPDDVSDSGSVLTINTQTTDFPVELSSITVTGGKKDGNGGGINLIKGTLRLNNGAKISGNYSSDKGGGIYVGSDGTLFMYGSSLIGDTVGYTATSDTLTTSGNTGCANAASEGGGIYNEGKVYIGYSGFDDSGNPTGTTMTSGYGVRRNYSDDNGGGIYNAGTFKISSGCVSYNYALEGGAITISSNTDISAGTFENNKASSNGGAIMLYNYTLNLGGNAAIKNNSAASGGAIYQIGTLNLSGHVCIYDSTNTEKVNDIYLSGDNTVNISDTLYETKVATLTPSTWDRGHQVISGGAALVNAHYNKFEIGDDEWNLVLNDSKGKIDADIWLAGGTLTNGVGNTSANGTRGKAPSDFNRGTKKQPYETLAKAVGQCWKGPKDTVTDTGRTINIDGTVTALTNTEHTIGSSITSDKATAITLLGNGSGATLKPATGKRVLGIYTALPVTIKMLTITEANFTGNGAGIYVSAPKARLTLSDGTSVYKNTASGNGGGIYIEGSSGSSNGTSNAANLIMKSGDAIAEVRYNLAGVNGGGIYLSYANLCMSGSAVIGDKSSTGYQDNHYAYTGAAATFNENRISNRAKSNGGGIYCASGSSVWLGYKKASDNNDDKEELTGGIHFNGSGGSDDSHTDHYGFGIYAANGSSIKMSSGEISKNGSEEYGGGVYIEAGAEMEMSGGRIFSNSAYYGGGVCTAGNFTMTGGTIGDSSKEESAESYNKCSNLGIGGGIYGEQGSVIDLRGGNITYNYSQSDDGGGIYTRGKLDISGTACISYNKAYSDGGGIYFYYEDYSDSNSELNISGGTIMGNSAGNGAGIYLYEPKNVVMSGGVIKDNKASGDGGGIFIKAKMLSGGGEPPLGFKMTGGLIGDDSKETNATSSENSSNYAGNNGGGIFIYRRSAGGFPYTLSLEGGTIAYNYAAQYGGAVNTLCSTTIKNTIKYNGATYTGGVYCQSELQKFTLDGARLIGNASTSSNSTSRIGGAIYYNYISSNPIYMKGQVSIPSKTATLGDNDLYINIYNPDRKCIWLEDYLTGTDPIWISGNSDTHGFYSYGDTAFIGSQTTPTNYVPGSYMKFGIISNGSSDYTVNSDGKLITAKKITKSMCENILDNITNGTTYNIVIGPDVTNTEFRKFMDKMFNTSYNSTGKKVGNNSVLDLSKNTQITQFGLGYSGNIPVDHKFTKIIIPPNLAVTRNNILDLTQNFRNAPSYDVPAECTNFISYDGVLYDKDKTKIMAYPPGKTGTSFTIPFTTVTEIYDYAFNHQKYLTTPPLSGITTIGYSSFTHSVITSLDLQSSIQVADGAFWCCESLTSLTIRNGRTKIEKDMFRQCKKLTSISLPASIEEIGTTAFAYNDKLASINIPANTTKIGNQAFKDCPLLTSVNFANPNGWVRDSTGAAVDFTDDPAANAAIITSLPAIHRE